MAAEAKRRSVVRPLVALAMLLFPLAGLSFGIWLSQSEPAPTVANLLRPTELEVVTRDTAAAQYLEAARLNEPSAWMKVIEAFPPEESPINAAYAIKSRIQLGRLHRERGQFDDSESQLRQVLSESTLPNHYRAIALAELLKTQLAADKVTAAAETRNRLRQSYQLLESTPDKLQLFNQLYGADFVLPLQTS